VLDPDGVIIIREADASGGWRFPLSIWSATLSWLPVAVCFGRAFISVLLRPGATRSQVSVFEVSLRAAGQGTAFANVLLYAKRPVSPLTSERVPAESECHVDRVRLVRCCDNDLRAIPVYS
jgi:hypothetical protein